MGLFCELIDREVPELNAEERPDPLHRPLRDLDEALRAKIAEAEALTAGNERLRLFIAMNYGGRQEILDAARRFAPSAALTRARPSSRASSTAPTCATPSS